MASKALISTASSALVSNRYSSSPLSAVFGPRQVSFSSNSLTSKRPSPLVVRAQQNGEDTGIVSHGSVTITSTGGTGVHSPWNIIEDEHEVRMVLDMPGAAAEDISVKVEGDMLVIKDLGRQLYSPYDTIFQLAPYCQKQDISATLKDGVLHITVPKKAILVPIIPTPTVEELDQTKVPGGGFSTANVTPDGRFGNVNISSDGSFGTANVTSEGRFGNVNLPSSMKLQDWHNRISLLESPNYVRIPWGRTEDNEEVRVSFDLPGLSANEIRVTIMGELLLINSVEGKVDGLGRKILECHASLHLPTACSADRAHAILQQGILYITVPKLPLGFSVTPRDIPVTSV